MCVMVLISSSSSPNSSGLWSVGAGIGITGTSDGPPIGCGGDSSFTVMP